VKQRDTTMEVEKARKKTERDLELEQGSDYYLDLRKEWDLKRPEEKYDILPEIWNGHNVADFIDPDIMAKLDELEAEEDKLMNIGYYDEKQMDHDGETKDLTKLAKRIRETRKLGILESRINKPRKRSSVLPRTAKPVGRSRLEKTMTNLGLDMSEKDDAHYNDSVARSESHVPVKRQREDSEGVVRSSSRMPRDKSGVRDASMAAKVRSMSKVSQRKLLNKTSKQGEADRVITCDKPKHLFAGKRPMGKTDRR
jgi:nucleolar GTP-binding protein